MEKFFHLKENGTTVSTEILAGLTTFFAMAYIIVVNPQILSQTGMPWGGVFLATIIAAIIGTLVMGLFANVPYAQAAGMGLNAFFTYTVCFGLGFSWQQTMCMVFLCGLINILITVTKIRKMIILAIPESLQHAIGGGILLYEIQQSSDVTYRLWDFDRVNAAGEKRPLHIRQSLDVIVPELTGQIAHMPENDGCGLVTLLDVPAFHLECANVNGECERLSRTPSAC